MNMFLKAKETFEEVIVHQIAREENNEVEELVNVASSLTNWVSRDPLRFDINSSLMIQGEESKSISLSYW